MPKLSIITVNLNNVEGLKKTIQSVINQTFTDYEYIIIDGGSTDGSVDVIKKYEDKITYWISEPDRGIYNAMNKGIRVAKGEYCLFLNSGDWLIDNFILEKVFDLNFNEDIVYGNIQIGEKIIRPYRKITLRKLIKSYIPHPASFIKKQLLINLGLYDEKYKIASDWKFFLQALIIENCPYKYIDKNITFFEKGGISGTKLRLIENEKILYELFPRIIDDYKVYTKIISTCKRYKNSKLIYFTYKIVNLKFYKKLKLKLKLFR